MLVNDIRSSSRGSSGTVKEEHTTHMLVNDIGGVATSSGLQHGLLFGVHTLPYC